AAAHRHRAAVFALGLWGAVVADGDVNPAVEPHANAVGGVVSSPLVDHVTGQTGDENLRFVGDTLATVVVDAEEPGVQHPKPAGALTESRNVRSSIGWLGPALPPGRPPPPATGGPNPNPAGTKPLLFPASWAATEAVRFSANVFRSGGCGAAAPGGPNPGGASGRASAAVCS